VYLTAAVSGARKGDYSLRALCLDAKTGDIVWDQEVLKEIGAQAPVIHTKNSHASPTPLVDGEQVFVHFGHLGTACLAAKDGKVQWTQQTLKYNPVHGAGGSPVIAGGRLVFCIDGTDKQMVVALDRKTGKVAWQAPRKTNPVKAFSFSTPLLISDKGQEQLIAAGSDVVMSLDPKTGREIWRVRYTGYSVVPRPVYGNGMVYLSTGYDSPQLYAIKTDGKGDVTRTHVAWTAKSGAPRNASPLLVDDALYLAADDGTVTCLDAKTGKERWSERVGRAYSASPIYAGGLIYLMDEFGTATVFKPGAAYDPVATNRMGEKSLASYGVDGNALLLRTEKALYRIEQK
jgi:outer membrane protein assembly factor BamB